MIAAFRLIVATEVMGLIVLFRYRTDIKNLSKKQLWILALSGLFLAAHFASWITSLEYTSVVSSVVLVCSTPLWVALLSPLVVKEKPGKLIWIGMAITLGGAVIVGVSGSLHVTGQGVQFNGWGLKDQTRMIIGNMLALIGAWFETGYILIGRGERKKIALIPYTFIVYGSGALVLLLFVIAFGLRLSGYSQQTYIWMTALALVPQLLGHTSFNWALGYLNAAFVSVALLGEPVGTSVLSFLILKQSPTVFEAVGGILILIGIYITSRSKP